MCQHEEYGHHESRLGPFICPTVMLFGLDLSCLFSRHLQSTVANALDAKLTGEGRHTYILDGDNVRHGLNSGLGFSPEDRRENVRRVAEVARLMVDLGIIVLVPVIRSGEHTVSCSVSLPILIGEGAETFGFTPRGTEPHDKLSFLRSVRKNHLSRENGVDQVTFLEHKVQETCVVVPCFGASYRALTATRRRNF